MTWVVGITTPFGYGACIADTQVIWKGSERRLDCLQKIHQISDNMVVAFAGSVRLGFHLLADLRNFMLTFSAGKADMPRALANDYYRRARRRISQEPRAVQRLGVRLLIAGASVGETFAGGRPRSDLIVLNSVNDFEPCYVEGNVASIGKGAKITKLREVLDERYRLLGAEMLGPGGYGRAMASTISMAIQEFPTAGISSAMHLAEVFPHGVRFSCERRAVFNPERKLEQVIELPATIFDAWDAFREYAETQGLTAEASEA